MTATQEFFAFFSTAVIMALFCKADLLPEPSGLTYRWVDPFTLNLSWTWMKPKDWPCTLEFWAKIVEESGVGCQRARPECIKELRTQSHNAKFNPFLTEEGPSEWKASVQVFDCRDCGYVCASKNTNVSVYTPKTAVPRAELVKDFRCLIRNNLMSCSWTPAKAAIALNVTYRFCNQGHLKVCDQPHSNSCVLEVVLEDDPLKVYPDEICVSVQTATEMSTFKITFEVDIPMYITESGGYINLEWEPPEIGKTCWTYNVSYRECNKQKDPITYTPGHNNHSLQDIPYNRNCHYEFEYSISTKAHCPKLIGIPGSASYGINASPDQTMTVIAIVIPIILSACVFLSCFCFRRHRTIICPVLPDPSQIFKDFMNGNRELKFPAIVCEQEAEIFVPIVISPVSEESDLQQSC
ncbi:uncharacterized protein LOC114451120 [Parambassis ranga]|uniref:Uncharacterized protein LOC114451120 n=1 Tax=Parambassis ranga TaxID=210632 RepID=A0A6P7K819_9TELE|nr:uncharacterized protein LOC114451120 [Parambassis ranga]